jgi:hypothetical protein
MMSLQTIRDLSRQMAVNAAANEVVPFNPKDVEAIKNWRRFPFPNIGEYRPGGWWLVDDAFCDKTGFDASGPAMSVDGLKQWCAEKLEADPTAGFAIIEEGEFQLYVGYFTQNKEVAEANDIDTDVEPEEFEFVWCEACDKAFEPEDGENNPGACPFCGYDPNECPECGCNPCECKDDDDEDHAPIWNEGLQAYRNGKGLAANPYTEPFDARTWEDGWTAGKDEELWFMVDHFSKN